MGEDGVEAKMKNKRDITIKVIYDKKIIYNRLAEYFARRYGEKETNEKS